MYGVLVQFPAEAPLSTEQCRQRWEAIAPMFEKEPGFVHKAFLRSPDGITWGGFYLWQSREAAEAYYTPEWRQRMSERYGAEPSVTFFEVPAVAGASVRPGLEVAPSR
ncbi:MAG: YdhR family protein [Chloroflexi bacterium]|nr:YdhR family protein [Chloroflexota bacterium]GIW10041.1 MAG: monooxygenase [Dehalococcoidia bacterium]